MDNLDINSLKTEFETKDSLQREFGSFENYLSYIQAGAGEFVSDPVYCFSDGAEDVAVETLVKFDENTAGDDLLREHFAKSQRVQDEYGDVQSYLAYVRHHRQRVEVDKVDSGATGNFDEAGASDKQLEEHFAQTQKLQDQFSDPESYLAVVHYQRRRAEREGQKTR